MFEDSRLKWALVTLGILILLFLSIWGVFSIARNMFKSDDPTKGQVSQTTEVSNFNQPGTVVRLEVQGAIVADSQFQSYRITIGRTEKIFQLMQGYEGTITTEQRYDNNPDAYEAFLRAITNAGFAATTNLDSSFTEVGSCSLGRRYIYSANDGGEDVFRSWGTSCTNARGSSQATSTVRTLFIRQIPDFSTLTTGTTLR